uniref:Cardioactive peptide Ocp-3/Ocp-4 n=1 Tax=Callistoctopus minor TaxID=515824 RepID=OCP3_CALMC
GSWD